MTDRFRSITITGLMLVLLLWIVPVKAQTGLSRETGWQLADAVVATIDGEPVLRSDIILEKEFGLLEASGGTGRFEDLREVYLNRLLILREVDELGGYRLNSGEAEGAYRGYLSQYSDRSEYLSMLHRWGIEEEEIFRRLKNALLATLYTESRLQFLVNILPSDIEEAYAKEPERWGSRDLNDSWEAVRADLIKKTFAMEKERWIKTLRDRYKLVLIEPIGEGSP